MSYNTSQVARASLRFAEEVKKAFAFLTSEYDFHLVSSEVTFVRYESPLVFINVYHGRISYELGLEFGRMDEPGEVDTPFGLGDLISMHDAEAGRRYRRYQTSEADHVPKGLTLMAADLSRYGTRALRGDPLFFVELHKVRQRIMSQYWSEMKASQIRPQAETAWKKHDYARVVSLYGQIMDHLSPTERKKLDYARKRGRIK